MKTRRLIFACFSVLFFSGCTLFPKEEKLLKVLRTSNRHFEVYSVSLGATTDDVLHIKEVLANERRLLKVVEGYNKVLSLRPLDKDTLLVVLTDTGYLDNKPDTLKISVKDQ